MRPTQFVAAVAACFPMLVGAATTTTAVVTGTQSFNVVSSPLGGIAGCGISVGSHAYGTTTFTSSIAAQYAFTGIAQTGTPDSFLAVYQGSFDPAAPTANLIGCNDDGGGGFRPKFVSTLNAATTYVMVATQFAQGNFTGSVTFTTGIVPTITIPTLNGSVGEAGRSVNATSNSSAPITYTSSNLAVATVDATTGALTYVSVGTAQITASQAAEPDPQPYTSGSASRAIVVAAVPVVIAPTSIPTLSEWGLILTSLLLGGFAFFLMRRK